MIAINTLLLIAAIFFAWRKAAWGVAFISFALGLAVAGTGGPLASAVRTVTASIQTLLNAIGQLVT